MEVSKEEASRYLHENFVVRINQMRKEPHLIEEAEQQICSMWGALGVLKKFGVLSVDECQSVLNQVGSSFEASNL